MIAYLQGKVLSKGKQNLILLCESVGYEIFCPSIYLEKLLPGDQTALFIYSRVREDEFSLYGFPTSEAIDFFKLLIGVNGVGPKTALEILNIDANTVKNAIAQENSAFLSKVPGIGKKTAERIIVDLKNKVLPESFTDMSSSLDKRFEEVMSALNTLGYQHNEINRVLKTVPAEVVSSEELITFFLRNV